MAKLTQPDSNAFETGPLAPTGTFVAACLEVLDQFGVDRPKFENPNETETIDVTRFLFGFLSQDGQPYKVQSFEFRISGSPKSNLFKFLTAWLGQPPKYGWDYCELKGEGAMITVAHKQSRDLTKTYANLIGISPVINQLKAQIPSLSAFEVGPDCRLEPNPDQHQPPVSSNQPQPPYPQSPTTNSSATPASSAVNTPKPNQSVIYNQQSPIRAQGDTWNPNTDPEEKCPF